MLVTHSSQVGQIVTDLISLRGDEYVAIDTETTGLHIYGEDRLTGISLAYRDRSWYVPVAHAPSDVPNQDPEAILSVLRANPVTQVYHHGKFDWAALRGRSDTFLVPSHTHWDTQVVDWLMDENARSHGLKQIAARLWGEDEKAEQNHLKSLFKGRTQADLYRELRADPEWAKRPAKEARAEAKRLVPLSRKTWATLTAEDIAAYGEYDAVLTKRIYEWQRERLANPYPKDLPIPQATLDREFAFQGVLYRMVTTGIRVDPEAAIKYRDSAMSQVVGIEADFGINLRSNAEVGALIYDDWELPALHVTKGGARSVAKAALEELEGSHPGIERILEHRHLTKAIGTYFDPLVHAIGRDGRIHSSFSSTRTVTGRLSSSDPNLQNIPKAETNAEVRAVFVPEPGMELWEYDLSQAELRIMAGFANEEVMISAIAEGRDLHGETAESIFGPDYTVLQRRLAKNLNFGFGYGIQARKFSTYMVSGTGKARTECAFWRWQKWDRPPRPRPCGTCHVCQANQILQGYRRTYPALVTLMDGMTRQAKSLGYVPLHVEGRYRRFRGPGYMVPEFRALNAIVQGGVGEFMKDVMIESEHEVGEYGRMCLQIHDSLVIEVEPGAGQRVGEVLQSVADAINPFRMPMVFDANEWGQH